MARNFATCAKGNILKNLSGHKNKFSKTKRKLLFEKNLAVMHVKNPLEKSN